MICFLLSGCAAQDSYIISDTDTSDSEELNTNVEVEVYEQTISTEPETICVFVCGQVVNPGVYYLAEGCRICDALVLAGGCLETADINAVNQAERLLDGSKIYIPGYDEDLDDTQVGQVSSQNGLEHASESDESGVHCVNLNTATKDELLTIPGVGESKANAILKYRDEHGRFESVDEIKNIAGIKDGIFNQIKDYIMVK